MAEITKLSTRQILFLLVLSRLNTAYTYLPAVATPPANQDVWIAEILSVVYTFGLCGPLLYLSNRFENMTLLEYTEKIMGKLAGKFLGLLIAAQLMIISLLQLPLLDNLLRAAIMPETPDAAILLFMLPVCVYAVYKGPEALGRLAEIFAPLLFATIIIFTLLNINKMEFAVLLPVLADSTLRDLNIGAFNVSSRCFEIIALAMFVPYINEKGAINRIFIYYIAVCTVFFLIITLSVQTVLGTELAAKVSFPYYVYTQTIKAYDVVERIDPINAFSWIFGIMLKYSLLLYLTVAGLAQVFGVKSYKTFILPITLLQFIVVLKTPLVKFNVMSSIMSYKFIPFITLPGMFVIPLVVLAVYFLRRESLAPYR